MVEQVFMENIDMVIGEDSIILEDIEGNEIKIAREDFEHIMEIAKKYWEFADLEEKYRFRNEEDDEDEEGDEDE